MKSQNINYLSDLHFDHKLWVSELSFWNSEITYFEKQLDKIIKKYRDDYSISKAEQFQNVFRVHREMNKAIELEIDRKEKQTALILKAQPMEVNDKYFQEHEELREKINAQRRLFREMKEDFFIFMSHQD